MTKPAWMIEEDKAEQAKKTRAASKRVFINKSELDNSEVEDDRAREEAYHTLIEDTGNMY